MSASKFSRTVSEASACFQKNSPADSICDDAQRLKQGTSAVRRLLSRPSAVEKAPQGRMFSIFAILMLDCIALMENRMIPRQVINATVSPKGSLETLSQREVQQLSAAGSGSTYTLFRQCALAILNTGAHVDNAKTILEAYESFEVRIHQQDRGVRLELLNAPADAFVDGEMIASTREMLFSALRDIVYTESELDSQRIDL
ncbi:Decarboxylase, partial [Pseudomonas syringae pv. coryli]